MEQLPQMRFALLVRRRAVRCCAWLAICSCCAGAFAQGEPPPEAFKRYPLRHKAAADVGRMLAELLGNEVETIVDSRGNQILVRGPDQSQRVAQRLIAALDEPTPAQDSGPVPNEAGGRETQEHFVALSSWRADQVEPMLRKLLGSRLTRQPSRRGGVELTVTDDSGTRVALRVDESRRGLTIVGPEPLASQVVRLVQAQESSRKASAGTVRTVSLRKADPQKVQEALDAYRRGNPSPSGSSQGAQGARVSRGEAARADPRRGENPIFVAQVPAGEAPPAGAPPAAGTPAPSAAETDKTRERLRELGLDLDIETLPDLDAIILRGSNRDVNEVLRIIEDIERISAETVPTIEVYPLKHVGSEALAPMLALIQRDLLAGRPGRVSISALNKPNALLLIGWGEAIHSVKELIEKLDQPVEPQTQLRVFRLRHAPASAASTTVQEFFAKRTGLGPKVTITPDVRSNSLIVQAAPRDMSEVELLVNRIDTGRSESVNQVRVFRLKNSLALNLATTLQAAMDAHRPGQAGAAGAAGPAGAKSSILELLTVDPEGEKVLKSGILADVRITPDPRANTLVVSAPAESMELVAALIGQMDESPVAVSQIKVFHIVNGDAPSLVLMLKALLPSQMATTPGATLAKAEGETSFAPLRYSVEPRTNSIIAAGSAGDLAILEALLLRLDEKGVQQRKNTVVQLKNAPALDVSDAINQFLRSERQVQQAAPGTISPFQQIESEVIVVPEPVTNSLIISATPRFYDEIFKMVQKLDAQPPQVLIQVLIAEVTLNDTTQFGVELGLQDGLLFDRSLLGGLVTTNTSTTFGNPPTTTQTQTIQAASNTPGFDFNNATGTIGNSGSTKSLDTAARTAAQGLSNFAVGRTSPDLGFGGLVLSAGSKSINVLLRALQENQRLDILSRPQVMTIDNQPAFIQVGQKVPRVTNISISTVGQTSATTLENVGLMLAVTPRISPDGMVVMEIDAEKSDVAPEIEGIPVGFSASGQVIRSPRYNVTQAQTTISTASGETIVLGGLITKSEQRINRRVPYLSDVPVLGQLFRYDQFQAKRTELLIILTPHVVRNAEDAERLKQIEAARMHWCAADIHAIHGASEFCKRGDCPVCNAKMPVVYPDLNPSGIQPTPLPDEMLPGEPTELPEAGVSARRAPSKAGPTEARPRNPAVNELRLVPPAGVQPSAWNFPPPAATPGALVRPLPWQPGPLNPPPAVSGASPPRLDPTRTNIYPGMATSYQGP